MGSFAPNRQHVLVVGASIGGLLAAKAAASHFQRVTVLERDPLTSLTGLRDGVPQAKHIHVLLPAGIAAVERLFPGGTSELTQNGAQPFDYGRSEFFIIGTWMPRIQTGLNTPAQTRLFLEEHIRRWLGAVENVEILSETQVSSLLWNEAHSQVTGVALKQKGDTKQLEADLVIDATGRNTRLPRWLTEHGFPPVPEDSVGIDLGHATGSFRVPPHLYPTHPMLYIVGPPPHKTRVGVRVLVEKGIVYGDMGGYHGDHPPSDLTGFLDFAKSLSQPDVFDILSRAELLSPIARYRIFSSNRRYYAKMARFPDGVLPLGDSICNFDPAFGQGMAVAALEAEALGQALGRQAESDSRLRRDYFRLTDSIVDVPWELSCGENFKYSQTTGRRPLLFPLTRSYKDRLATCGDPGVVRDFYRVLCLTAPPRILIRPQTVARALLSVQRSNSGSSMGKLKAWLKRASESPPTGNRP
jgi:2-polyprenyl-6-methoxyphenol hydroxylase-like FAD-dependent oxidoreductase